MKCEGKDCGKEIPERYKYFDNRRVLFPYCEACEKKLKYVVETYPGGHGRKPRKPKSE